MLFSRGWQGRRVLRNVAPVFALLLMLLALPVLCSAQTIPTLDGSNRQQKLVVTIKEEHEASVSNAVVLLTSPQLASPLRCETNSDGHCEFSGLSAGAYSLSVEKVGFYPVTHSGVQVGTTNAVDVILIPKEQVHQVVKVQGSSSTIDPEQISAKEQLTATELIDIPYPGPHDYRNALTYIPGTTPDAFGQFHIAGAETYQTLTLLDGFNVTQPASGQLEVRTAVDSFRSINIEPSREPAEFGKGSGGILNLNTTTGGENYHFVATDFLPSVQDTRGISLNEWTPIATVSGPLQKNKGWFLDALDGEYDNDIILAGPQTYRDQVWRMDNLAKAQFDLTPRNNVTVSFLSNYLRDPHAGVSALDPPSATPLDVESAYFGSIKEQYSFASGALLETGFGATQFTVALTPAGAAPSATWQGTEGGNYYLNENTVTRRWQGFSNLYLAPRHWHGRHDIKTGIDVDRLHYESRFTRQPISFLLAAPPQGQQPQPCATDANGVPIVPSTCSRYSVFSGGNFSATDNFESSAYVEDRWLITNHLLLEPGIRFDWDEIVREPLFSPRLAGTYVLDNEGNTKFSAGVGIVYDATHLGLIAEPLAGQRIDYFFDTNGNPTDVNGNPATQPIPVATNFTVNRSTLEAPRFLNWSVALEKKLPASIFMKAEFIEKRGTRGFVYNSLDGANGGDFVLQNTRNDSYDGFTVSLRHNFRDRYSIFGAYTRSRAYSNQVLDFDLDLLVWSPQLPGPYSWDVPNRFIGWGILPVPQLIHQRPRNWDLVYSVEARDGIPFNVANDRFQAIAADPPGTFRLPAYFSLNLALEKRLHLFGFYWAVRGGCDNITNHANVAVADGILDAQNPSPTYIDQAGRTLTFRMRLLGRN